ncbi:MAG: hypothetical protein V4598_00310 [Bdellovibrionota bacterium]
MKKTLTLALTLLSAATYARPPHMSAELKACFDQLKNSTEISAQCQELFSKHEERREKMKECMAAIDAADVTDTTEPVIADPAETTTEE